MIGWTYRRAKRVWTKLRPPPIVTPDVVSVRIREIAPPDLEALIDLLTKGYWRAPRSYWAGVIERLTEHQTPQGYPKYGYLIENDGTPVGVILMIFTARVTNGETRVWCCGSSYYVEPQFRPYGPAMMKRAHRFKDVTYLSISPSPHTWAMLGVQGFKRLTTGVYAAIPALCPAKYGVRVRVIKEHDARLTPFEADLLESHASFGCISVVCEHQGGVHPFVFVVRRRYGLPYAYLVYSRDQADFITFAGTLGRFLAKRGVPSVVLDADGPIDGMPGKHLELLPRFWKGNERPRLGDLAYTEIPMFGVI